MTHKGNNENAGTTGDALQRSHLYYNSCCITIANMRITSYQYLYIQETFL